MISKALPCPARRVWFVSVVILASLAGSPVRATTAEAQDLAARAHQRDALGDHHGAIELLEQAFQAEANPEYLRDIASQYVALTTKDPDPRELRLALAFYRQYLLVAHTPPDAGDVQAHLATLEKQIALVPFLTAEHRSSAVEAVDVHFIATRVGASYRVSVGTQSCQTPCTLSLKPGAATVMVNGFSSWHLDLVIPSTPGLVRIEPNPSDLVLAGSLLFAGGVVIGTSLWTLALACPYTAPTDINCTVAQVTVWPLVGGLAMLTGIGLLAYAGAHPSRPSVETADAEPPAEPRVRFAFAGVQPLRNGFGTSVGFEF